MLKTGVEVAGYRIARVIGAGGMGVVYEATQLALERSVALKVIAPHLSADPGFEERFRREAMLQAALEHPHVVTVYEAGESEDGLYLAMKLVRGPSLKQLILEGGLGVGRAVTLLAQIASALDAAHAAGLIHRDVKPQNVLVGEGDHAYLADFGLVRAAGAGGVTGSGRYLGSLDYATPEQIRGEPLAPASDVYSLACVLYEALVGEVPFPRETEAALLYAHLTESPPRVGDRRPELPAGLDAVLARGLAKDPAERYATASELVGDAHATLDRAVQAIVAGAPGPPAPPRNGQARARFGETVSDRAVVRAAPVIRLEPERRLARWAIAGLAALALAAVAGGFMAGRSHDRVRAQHGESFLTAGPLAVAPPGGWQPSSPPPLGGLELAGAASMRSDEAQLTVGTTDAGGPTLLPASFVAQVQGRATREPVRLGRLQAFRYARVRNRQVPGRMTVYVLPTTTGVATLACVGQDLVACEAVAATLTLHGARALPLHPSAAYLAAAHRAVARLDARRVARRAQLRRARTPFDQVRAATRLATAYADAAAALRKTTTGPIERPANDAAVAAFGRAAAAYRELATATKTRVSRRYRLAATKVRRAEAAVARALRVLPG
jgi:hypothetical protein